DKLACVSGRLVSHAPIQPRPPRARKHAFGTLDWWVGGERTWPRRLMLALMFVAAVAAPARSDSNDRGMARAEALYEKARYKEALRALPESCAGAAPCERLRAFIHTAIGEEAEAKAAFERLLAVDPEAVLPDDVSPKISAVFDSARGTIVAARDIQLTTGSE